MYGVGDNKPRLIILVLKVGAGCGGRGVFQRKMEECAIQPWPWQLRLRSSNSTHRNIRHLNSGPAIVSAGGDLNKKKSRRRAVGDIGPLLLEVKPALSSRRKRRLKYYTWLAARLAEEGRLADFANLARALTEAGAKAIHFVQALDMNLIWSGFSREIENGNLDLVLDILAQLQQADFHPPRFLDANARHLLSKECWKLLEQGNVTECVTILEKLAGCLLPIKEFVEPTFVIQHCVMLKDVKLALRYVRLLPRARVWFNFVIHEFGNRGDLYLALIAFQGLKEAAISPDMYSYRNIIDACGLCGKPAKARTIFKELLNQKVTPNVFLYNSYMNVNAADLNYVLQIYKIMQSSGVTADVTTYSILMKACCIAGNVDLAKFFYKETLSRAAAGGLKMDVIIYSTIIQVFGEAKMWDMAIEVKQDMIAAGVRPNVVTWTSLIGACSKAGLVEKAIQVFDEMVLSGCEPNTQCCNTLLHACVDSRQYDRAFQLFHTWRNNGFCKAGPGRQKKLIPEAMTEIFLDAEKLNSDNSNHDVEVSIAPINNYAFKMSEFKPTVATYNILMKACGATPNRAEALMKEMEILGIVANRISWSILIDVYGTAGDLQGVMQTFKKMHEAGVKPDVITYTTVIKACVCNKYPEEAFLVFARMKKHRLQPNVVTYNTLLRARRTYGDFHEVQQALAIYEEMRKAGYAPNDGLLKGLLEEWSEGVIHHNNSKNQDQLRKEKLIWKQRESMGQVSTYAGLFLERIAAHARLDNTNNLTIDLHGFTKTEARIAVLAVLRMIRERHGPENPIQDDLIIIIGMAKNTDVQRKPIYDAVVQVLQDELGLQILFEDGDKIVSRDTITKNELCENTDNHQTINDGISACYNLDGQTGIDTQLTNSGITIRRPPNLERLTVSRKSLNHWLQRRSSVGGKYKAHVNNWWHLAK